MGVWPLLLLGPEQSDWHWTPCCYNPCPSNSLYVNFDDNQWKYFSITLCQVKSMSIDKNWTLPHLVMSPGTCSPSYNAQSPTTCNLPAAPCCAMCIAFPAAPSCTGLVLPHWAICPLPALLHPRPSLLSPLQYLVESLDSSWALCSEPPQLWAILPIPSSHLGLRSDSRNRRRKGGLGTPVSQVGEWKQNLDWARGLQFNLLGLDATYGPPGRQPLFI